MVSHKSLYVKEVFSSFQGEGPHAGLPATFVRLSGCNVSCPFCDTDFSAGDDVYIDDLKQQVVDMGNRMVIFTGGEPALQAISLSELAWMLQKDGFITCLETNGTLDLEVDAFHTIVCSPKAPIDKLKLSRIDAVKVLFPYIKDQTNGGTELVTADSLGVGLVLKGCKWFGLQPVDMGDSTRDQVTQKALDEIRALGEPWRLSLQTHKFVGAR